MAPHPRALLVALLEPSVVDALWDVLTENGLDTLLGKKLFDPGNWHQSISGRHFSPTDNVLRKLCAAGSHITAEAFQMQFNRILSKRLDHVHWRFEIRGRPKGFDLLLQDTQRALAMESIADGESHSPHATFCYSAPEHRKTLNFDPIPWFVDEVQLVIGENSSGSYRYRILERWPLNPIRLRSGDQISLL